MKRKVFLVLAFVFLSLAMRAETLTIDQCKQRAHDNYPAIRQYGLIEKSAQLTVSNAQKAWLPGVNVMAFGGAFTDIIEFPAQSKAIFGDMKNYLAGGSVTINQTIYDGGQISANKQIAKAKADVQTKTTDVSMYAINSQVEELFFGVLMLDEQLNQNSLLQKDLGISRKTVESLTKGGLANQSDLDAVDVRIIQCQQQEISLKQARKTYMSMLGYFTGISDIENKGLEKPVSNANLNANVNNRPELLMYASQERLLDVQRKALNTRLMPTVGAVGLATAHTKPLDMTKWNTLAIGVTARWNIGALYTRKNDIASIENQRQQIETQRQTFLFNNQLQNRQTSGKIDGIKAQMALDDKAVSLRQNIREQAEKKVQNGTETVNELLRDVNAVSEAKQQKAIHALQLLQEEYRLKTINNN